MNGARRTLLAVYGLLLIAAAVGLVVLAWNSGRQLDISSGSFRLIAHIDGNDAARVGFTLLMAAVMLAGVATLFVALAEPDGELRRGAPVRVRRAGGASEPLYADELEAAVRDDLERLPEVQSAAVAFRQRRGVIESTVTAMIDPGTSPRHVTNAISNTVVATLREQVSMESIAQPVVDLREGTPRPMDRWPDPPPLPTDDIRNEATPGSGPGLDD